MHTIYLDFETRSTIDLRETGVRPYVEHPTTDIWMVRYAIDDGPVMGWAPGEELPADLVAALSNPGVIVSAHNAAFEWNVINFICVPRYGWPQVDHTRLDCTAARAAVVAIPRSLDGASRAMGLAVEKDDEGHRLMLQMCRPRKARKNEAPGLYWWDTPDKLARLGEYCAKDVIVERELDKVLPPLTQLERQIWLLDFEINNVRGVSVDMDSVNAVVHAMNYAYHDLRRQAQELAAKHGGPEVSSYSAVQQIKDWIEYQGVEIDSLDKAAMADLLNQRIPDHVKDMIKIRQQGSRTSSAKAVKIQLMVASDNRLYSTLKYHGASTGRWTGQGVQLHNLPAREALDIDAAELALSMLTEAQEDNNYRWIEDVFEMSTMAIASGVIRPLLTASKGHNLYCADFSNIEGRVNAWLAGQTDLVQKFANNDDIYKDMAAFLYDIPVGKVSKAQRQLGKTIILGCGYQMGATRFLETCEAQGVEGVNDLLAERAVQAYREKNNKIVKLWGKLDEAVLNVVEFPGMICHVDDKVAFRVVNLSGKAFLICRLPSGRTLYYLDPKLEETQTPWGGTRMAVSAYTIDPKRGGGHMMRRSLYGGLLCENIVQAIARDLLAHAMLNCEAAGYKVILTVHDEVVTEACGGSVEELENLMCDLPDWAAGCPVAAEGWAGFRYRK